MATAYFCDGRIEDRAVIGEFPTLQLAANACTEHAKAHPDFRAILAAAFDGDDGFDMAVALGPLLRIYTVNA